MKRLLFSHGQAGKSVLPAADTERITLQCCFGGSEPFLSQSFPQCCHLCLCRMDDIQLCKEISRLKKDLQKLIALPGKALERFGELHPAAAVSREVFLELGSNQIVLEKPCKLLVL